MGGLSQSAYFSPGDAGKPGVQGPPGVPGSVGPKGKSSAHTVPKFAMSRRDFRGPGTGIPDSPNPQLQG